MTGVWSLHTSPRQAYQIRPLVTSCFLCLASLLPTYKNILRNAQSYDRGELSWVSHNSFGGFAEKEGALLVDQSDYNTCKFAFTRLCDELWQ